MRLTMARIIWFLHTSIVVFMLTGWAYPWEWAAVAILVGCPLIQLNWWIFGNRCVLTIIEEKLRGAPMEALASDESQEEPPSFVQNLALRFLGRPIPYAVANAAAYVVLWGSFTAVTVRYGLGHYA